MTSSWLSRHCHTWQHSDDSAWNTYHHNVIACTCHILGFCIRDGLTCALVHPVAMALQIHLSYDPSISYKHSDFSTHHSCCHNRKSTPAPTRAYFRFPERSNCNEHDRIHHCLFARFWYIHEHDSSAFWELLLVQFRVATLFLYHPHLHQPYLFHNDKTCTCAFQTSKPVNSTPMYHPN